MLGRLLKFMKGYSKECVLGPLFKMLEASFELMIPLVVASIVDIGVGNQDTGYIVNMCLVMIALGLVGLISALTAQYFAARAAVGFSARIRHVVIAHILRLDYAQIDTLGTSTLITRMTADIDQVQKAVNLTLRLLLRSPFVVFGAMIMAFTIDPQAALIFVGVIPVLSIVVFGIMKITMPAYKNVQQKLDGVTSATRQNLAGVRVLRAFQMERTEEESFSDATEELAQKQLSAGRIASLMNPVTFVIVNSAVILLLQTGALKVDGGILTQGMVIALYNYMSQILVELIKLADLIIVMVKAAACGNRIQSILDVEPTQHGAAVEEKLSGKVEFQNVTAHYPGAAEPSLENVTFTAMPGETVGIIGGTGSGKTTLVNLIPRLYDAAEGKVLLDGLDIIGLDRQSLCSQMGIVPQTSVLFKGTIRENLLWGKQDATDEELMEALSVAQAADIIAAKDGGLDARVEQGGANFSGGQRQRLAIARALVRKPAILILDDSASALDYATDANLRFAIRNMENPPTTFIVSQRAASVRYADLILVLDDGQVVGQGCHNDLLANCQVYQEIYYSQFPKEVVTNG